MKNRYDNNPGKDAAIANTRQSRLSSIHNSNNSFVKSQQAKLAAHAGKMPKVDSKSMDFSSYMCNNGMHAQEMAVKLTAGLDKTAFPVKGANSDDS